MRGRGGGGWGLGGMSSILESGREHSKRIMFVPLHFSEPGCLV